MADYVTAGHPTRPQRGLIDRRRTRVLELRQLGWDDVQIGRELRAPDPHGPDPDQRGKGFIGGYNPRASDDTLANNVRQDVLRALKVRNRQLTETAGVYVELVEGRIERLYAAMAPYAEAGDTRAAGICVQLIREICRIRGLYAPVKIKDVSDEDQTQIAEAVDELIGEIESALGRSDD
jgi:hypothetical protein